MSRSALAVINDDRGFAELARQQCEDDKWEAHLEANIEEAMADDANFNEFMAADLFLESEDIELCNMLLKSTGELGVKFAAYVADMCRWQMDYTFKHFRTIVDCATPELHELIIHAFFAQARSAYESFCEGKISKAYEKALRNGG